MIAFVRTANIAPGKTAAAIGFAHEIAGHAKSSYGVELEVLRPIGATCSASPGRAALPT